MNKIKIVAAIILVIVVAVVVYIFTRETTSDSSVMRAVPEDAGVVIKTSNINGLLSASNENSLWQQLKKLPIFDQTSQTIKLVDTLVANNTTLSNALRGKQLTISFHKEGKDKITALYAAELNRNDAERVKNVIESNAKSHGKKIAVFDYDRTRIFVVGTKKNKSDGIFSFAYVNGLFVASTSCLTTELAVRHIHSGTSISTNENLAKLLATEGKSADAILIVNYPKFYDLIKGELSQQTMKNTSKIGKLAEWSVTDINSHKNVITSTGFANANHTEYYADMFISQQPIHDDFIKYLPSKTSSFVSLGIKDMLTFKKRFIDMLKSKSKYNEHKKSNDTIRNHYNIDMDDVLYSSLKNRITEFTCNYSFAGRGNDTYVVAEIENEKKLISSFTAICNKNSENNKTPIQSFVTAKGNKMNVYIVPNKNLMTLYFSDLITAQVSYLTIYNSKAIFGSSISALKNYVDCIEDGKILASNPNFNEFSKYTTSKSNLFIYYDIAYSQNEIAKNLNRVNNTNWNKSKAELQNIRSSAVQISNQDDNKYYINHSIMQSQIIEADRYVSWISTMDTTVASKPQIVTNHQTNEKEIITVDATSKIYLINKNGEKIWKKQLPEPLNGQIYQIDYYHNGKLQYLFATDNYLHIIDRNGNYMDNYPVKLPSKLSAEISVYDYDNDGNYRIFAPCVDKKLYLYTKNGTPLDTWTPLTTKEPIITPVQYFRIDGNDYLVCADNLKTYILNRRGEVRINVTTNFPKGKNSLYYIENIPNSSNVRFVTSNSSGEIKYINIDGSCKSKKFKNYSANHHFVLQDIDGDGHNEYIFTDGEMIEVFKEDGTEIFSHCCDGVIGRPSIFTFASKDVRIGVSSRAAKKIYLFNNKGNICSGFPLEGTSEFSISKINSQNKFSIISGNSDNNLYNYQIQ